MAHGLLTASGCRSRARSSRSSSTSSRGGALSASACSALIPRRTTPLSIVSLSQPSGRRSRLCSLSLRRTITTWWCSTATATSQHSSVLSQAVRAQPECSAWSLGELLGSGGAMYYPSARSRDHDCQAGLCRHESREGSPRRTRPSLARRQRLSKPPEGPSADRSATAAFLPEPRSNA